MVLKRAQRAREAFPGHAQFGCDEVLLKRKHDPRRTVLRPGQRKDVAADALGRRAQLQVLDLPDHAAELAGKAADHGLRQRGLVLDGRSEEIRLNQQETRRFQHTGLHQIGRGHDHCRRYHKVSRVDDFDENLAALAGAAKEMGRPAEHDVLEGGHLTLLEKNRPCGNAVRDRLLQQARPGGRPHPGEERHGIGLEERFSHGGCFTPKVPDFKNQDVIFLTSRIDINQFTLRRGLYGAPAIPGTAGLQERRSALAKRG